MFQTGDQVICVDNNMDPIGPVLEKGKQYRVRDYFSPEDCKKLFPDEPWWQENGGRILLWKNELYTSGDTSEWFGRRFKLAPLQGKVLLED